MKLTKRNRCAGYTLHELLMDGVILVAVALGMWALFHTFHFITKYW